MSSIKILDDKEKAKIEKILNEEFGVDSVPGKVIMRAEERLFLFTGSLSEKEIEKLERCAFIERMGVYFARLEKDWVRLSIEGTQILKSQIKKNIFAMDSKQAEEWMKGRELPIKTGFHGFMVMKHGEDILGTGKASDEKIGNFIPKNRRLRERQQ